MKKRYQSDRELQLHLPLKQVAASLQEGVGELMRRAGLELMQLAMEDEVRRLAGERCRRRQRRRGLSLGKRTKLSGRRRAESQGPQAARAVCEFAEAYGIEKSAVSEHFIRVSRRKVRGLMERNLSGVRLCAIYLDGIEYKGRQMLAALGVPADGAKMVLGLRQGASENAVVVSSLLGDLEDRGVDFCEPRLYVIDGAKALVKALREHAGADALIQRCQVHKRRNVCGHLSEEHRDAVDQRMAAAYAMTSTNEAKLALERLHRELQELNPSAARSLEEGLEETLTVNRLPAEGWLRRTLATTNPIESAFSV